MDDVKLQASHLPIADTFALAMRVVAEVAVFFDDAPKALKWMTADNPSLGGISPVDMLAEGRGMKLLKFVLTRLREAEPPEEKTDG